MIKIESSNINSIAYNKNNNILTVEFKHAPKTYYQYYAVPENEYFNMLNNVSSGSYFANNIKGKYICKKLVNQTLRNNNIGDNTHVVIQFSVDVKIENIEGMVLLPMDKYREFSMIVNSKIYNSIKNTELCIELCNIEREFTIEQFVNNLNILGIVQGNLEPCNDSIFYHFYDIIMDVYNENKYER